MKKFFLLLVVCASVSQLKAQNGVVFKIKYLPGRNYATMVNVGMKINATLSGDQQLIDKLSAQGITQPMNASLSLSINGNTKTGVLNSDKTFPLNMDYKIADISVEANGKQFPIPPKATDKDIKASGHITQDWQLQIDSADGKKVNDTTSKKMQQMLDMFQKQIQFPDKPLKPGDTFTQGAPMNIPVKGTDNIVVNASTTYKLVSIADGKAYFDIVPNFSMDFKIKTIAVNVIGTGTGKMVYSIKDSFPISKEGTVNLKIKVTSDKINVDGTAVVTTKYSCTIN